MKILVITATLGNRPSLAKTIQSVKEIGGKNVTHIIVTPEKNIPQIKAQYNIECLPELPDKKGIYAALNHGFFTYGKNFDYLTFINDDDYWLPNFKILIEETQKNIDFVYGKVNFILENKDKQIKEMACSNQFKDFIPLLHHNIVLFTQQATLLKSDLFFKLGGFSEDYKLVSDTLFWSRLSTLNINFKYIPKVCAGYTIQDGQLSSNKNIQHEEMNYIIQNVLPKPKFSKTCLALFKYRLSNLHIYFKRYLKNNSK